MNKGGRTVAANGYSSAKINRSVVVKDWLFRERRRSTLIRSWTTRISAANEDRVRNNPINTVQIRLQDFLHRTERLRDSASVVSPIELTTGTAPFLGLPVKVRTPSLRCPLTQNRSVRSKPAAIIA